ncbi:MAG: hypothetical protein ACI4DS_00020 [Eubacterium sp.]
MIKSKKRRRIRLRSYTKGGRISSLFAVLAFVIFVVAVAWSYRCGGNAGHIVGYLGFLAFALNLSGFIIGIKSFKEEGLWLRYSWIGTIANAIMWIGILSILLIYV